MDKKLAINGGIPTRKEFLIFGSPLIGEEEIKEVELTLRSGWLSTGPKVARFEDEFKSYVGSKYAMALNSCTAALHLSLLAAGIGPGDEVITTPMTFAATANTIIYAGAKPVFVDINRSTLNIDECLIESAITDRTKAIMPVHFAGRPCNMEAILDIAKRHGLLVIEDAAHAIEAQYKGKKVGNIGDLTCFSFYVTKNLVTGEGGMVTTNNEEWAEKIQVYGLHGMSKGAWKRYSDEGFRHYQIVFPGYKYNMMDIQAAMGIHQLKRIDACLKRREEIWQQYDEALIDMPLEVPKPQEKDTVHARHLYTAIIDIDRTKVSRDHIQEALYRENIGTGIHFIALHLHPYYEKAFGYRRGDFPNAEYISNRTISLPLSAKLADQDIIDVVDALRKVLVFFSNN